MTQDLIEAYVDSFNRDDLEGMVATLTDDVVHDVNEGETEVGITLFRAFKARMGRHYREQLEEVVIFTSGDRGACEFMCRGEYLSRDGDGPEGHGQRYAIPAGFFVTVRDGRISRLTSYYNFRRWARAVSE